MAHPDEHPSSLDSEAVGPLKPCRAQFEGAEGGISRGEGPEKLRGSLIHRPTQGNPKRGILPNKSPAGQFRATFKSLESYLSSGSPFSDPPLGDGEASRGVSIDAIAGIPLLFIHNLPLVIVP